MEFSPDLDAYFARIGDDGSRTPNLQNLQRIVAAHVQTIPFENLDILLGRTISVRLEDIERKLIGEGRGGYCFEQNTLLQQVLMALGFEVRAMSARVRIGQPRSFVPPRTHQCLRVELEGQPYLVDVGVGGLSPTAALKLELDAPQTTPHESRRFVTTGEWNGLERRSPDALIYHQVLLGDTWQDVYDFTLEELHPIDRELGNWYTSAHPESNFRSRLTVARSSENGRVTILNRELKHRDKAGQATSRTLQSDEEILEALRDSFGLHFPAGTHFDCPGLAEGAAR